VTSPPMTADEILKSTTSPAAGEPGQAHPSQNRVL
jgi:hypothetical protein